MDLFHRPWSQIGLAVILQILYLEITYVTCFAWHNPTPTRSQLVPTQSHTVSQRWHQSVPKWYPYNMWKRRKRKDADLQDLLHHVIDNVSRTTPQKKDFMSKYRTLLNKLNRKKQMNNMFKSDILQNKRPTEKLNSLLQSSSSTLNAVISSKKTDSTLLRKHKSHFGGLGSFGKAFIQSAVPQQAPPQSGFDSGFGAQGASYGTFGTKQSGSFGDGFGTDIMNIAPKLDKEVEEPRSNGGLGVGSSQSSFNTGFGAGSWDTSDSFGATGSSSTSASWGDPATGNLGIVSVGNFDEETKDCETIDTKTCMDNSECSCYGLYTCSNQRCQQIQTSGSTSAVAGTWSEQPFDLGFSKRDPRGIVQIFMLPWHTKK